MPPHFTPHYLQLAEPKFGRAKRIRVWVNGETVNPCFEVNINPNILRTWNTVLHHLTSTLEPSFGAVRRLVCLSTRKIITCFEDLDPAERYVVLGANCRLKSTKAYKTSSEMQLKKPKRIQHRFYSGEIDPLKAQFLVETSKRGLTIIYIFVNGQICCGPVKVVFNEKDLTNWDVTLGYLSKILDVPDGIENLYTIFGDILMFPKELQHGYAYVALPFNEKFLKVDYMSAFGKLKNKTSLTSNIRPSKTHKTNNKKSRMRSLEKNKKYSGDNVENTDLKNKSSTTNNSWKSSGSEQHTPTVLSDVSIDIKNSDTGKEQNKKEAPVENEESTDPAIEARDDTHKTDNTTTTPVAWLENTEETENIATGACPCGNITLLKAALIRECRRQCGTLKTEEKVASEIINISQKNTRGMPESEQSLGRSNQKKQRVSVEHRSVSIQSTVPSIPDEEARSKTMQTKSTESASATSRSEQLSASSSQQKNEEETVSLESKNVDESLPSRGEKLTVDSSGSKREEEAISLQSESLNESVSSGGEKSSVSNRSSGSNKEQGTIATELENLKNYVTKSPNLERKNLTRSTEPGGSISQDLNCKTLFVGMNASQSKNSEEVIPTKLKSQTQVVEEISTDQVVTFQQIGETDENGEKIDSTRRVNEAAKMKSILNNVSASKITSDKTPHVSIIEGESENERVFPTNTDLQSVTTLDEKKGVVLSDVPMTRLNTIDSLEKIRMEIRSITHLPTDTTQPDTKFSENDSKVINDIEEPQKKFTESDSREIRDITQPQKKYTATEHVAKKVCRPMTPPVRDSRGISAALSEANLQKCKTSIHIRNRTDIIVCGCSKRYKYRSCQLFRNCSKRSATSLSDSLCSTPETDKRENNPQRCCFCYCRDKPKRHRSPRNNSQWTKGSTKNKNNVFGEKYADTLETCDCPMGGNEGCAVETTNDYSNVNDVSAEQESKKSLVSSIGNTKDLDNEEIPSKDMTNSIDDDKNVSKLEGEEKSENIVLCSTLENSVCMC